MPKLIVIVEDSETIAPLEIALGSLPDVALRHFPNGLAAAQFLRDSPAAAVITDLNLPLLDGFQLVEVLRTDTRFAHTPIIVISGDVQPDTPQRLRTLGVNAFFGKPYSPGKVRATLESLLYVE